MNPGPEATSAKAPVRERASSDMPLTEVPHPPCTHAVRSSAVATTSTDPLAISVHSRDSPAAAAPRAASDLIRDETSAPNDTQLVPSPPAADIALWSTFCVALPSGRDALTSLSGSALGTPPLPLSGESGLGEFNPLVAELSAQINSPSADAGDACIFQLELPGLGSLSGRLTIRANQQVDLELRAMKPAVATALRARRNELQQSVDRSTERDVNLFIL
jgi:hypothetical protein